MNNGRSPIRIPEGYPMPPDVPAAAPPEPTPAEKRAAVDRAERRRDRWEIVWSVAMLLVGVTIAIATVSACVALHGIDAENRRQHVLEWAERTKEASDGGK